MTRTVRPLAILGLLATGVALSGCATLPSSAPTAGQVTRGALASSDVRVVDLLAGDADLPSGAGVGVAPHVDTPPWSIADALPLRHLFEAGDRMDITIFELGYALFGPSRPASDDAESNPPSAVSRTFADVEVDGQGAIRLPYVGRLVVAGMSGEQVAKAIEVKLVGRSPHIQAMVGRKADIRESVIIGGDIKVPGRVGLTDAGERLLDVIAQAGGPLDRRADSWVQLTRDGAIAEARLDTIGTTSSRNVRLAPGDHVELTRRVRSLTVLGAAKTVAEVAFDSDRLSLAEALARTGGPADDRADATGVFVFRYVPSATDPAGKGVPTLYRINLLDPRGYFAIQTFQMKEKDVVLVANARSVQLAKLFQMLNQVSGAAVTAAVLAQ